MTIREDLCVLDVHVEDAVLELVDRAYIVHLLPDHVGRIKVQAEARRRDDCEHPSPHRGTDGHVFSTGPLVTGKQHRAVLNADPYFPLLRVRHDGRPDLLEQGKVFFKALALVPADERVGHVQAEQRRRVQDLQEMVPEHGRLGAVFQQIRIVPQP